MQTLERSPCAPLPARQRIEHGLAFGEFESLQAALSLPAERLAKATGIHPRTLQRRRLDGVFTFVESDRLYRFQDLFRRASEALESESAAASWLTRPSSRFDGLSPLDYAATEPGYQELILVMETIADDSFG
jgi:putative toxin-antitoxin system antitoxin component (TIGR02293 family)